MNHYNPLEVQSLAEQILKHKELYYAGTPIISDTAYDQLEEKLKNLCPEHPVLSVIGSGKDIDQNTPKINHLKPMLSLAKTYSIEELLNWKKDYDLMATLKIDGNSLSLIYENNKLILAKTRGNGKTGENVTSKIKWIADCIPNISEFKNLEIRGELYCSETNFIKLSQEMQVKNLEVPTNPRNTVAGILGRKQHISLARYFNFAAFDVLDSNGDSPFDSEVEKFQWLEKQNFKLPIHQLIKSHEEISEFLESAKNFMEADEIGIDGVVFSYNSIALHKELGETSHHPRYKLSFKWAGATAQATIKDIIWSTSRLGIITPVAVIEPVILSGATITNVTLHNAAHVKLFKLKAGDTIEIIRSGEVIPKFLQVISEGKGELTIPEQCPSCSSELSFDDVRIFCSNSANCPAQQTGTILNWIKAVNIEDLSEKRLQVMIDQNLISHMSDLYKLNIEDFLTLPSTKEKMATKLYQNIQKSKKISLANFLNGLGIAGAGSTTWEALLEKYPTLEKIRQAKASDIIGIDGFAEKMSTQIEEGLKLKSGDIEKLLSVGVSPIDHQAKEIKQTSISGKIIAITGTLSRPRSDFEKAIKDYGAKTTSSISKNTDALIIADPNSTSSKAVKARELGVELWSESDFWKKIEQS